MLYLTKQIGATQLAIWKIEESKGELLSMLENRDWIENILSIKSDKILLEKLAVRVLLKELFGEEKQVCYYSTGRPYLSDESSFITISHTRGYAVVAVNKLHPIGIDIEYISEKIRRVQSRVVSEKEYIDKDKELEHLLLHWSAKEAIFKVLDAEGIDYIDHIYVHPFNPKSEGDFQVSEYKTSNQKIFDLYYLIDMDYVLALTLN